MVKDKKSNKILNHLILGGIILFIMIIVSQIVGFGKTGFDSSRVLTQFMFYVGPGGILVIGIIGLFFIEYMINKGDEKYGDGIAFNSGGELPAPRFKFLRNPFGIFLISVIIFGLFGLFTAYSQITFTGIGSLEQQFTVLDNIIFTTALIPAAENIIPAFAFALFLVVALRPLSRRYNLSSINFRVLYIFSGIFIFAIVGLANHLLRYGASDIALNNVLIFWALGGLITTISGSFIPFWIMHASNNLFFDLRGAYGLNSILTGTLITIFIFAIVYLIFFVFMKRKER